MNTSPHPTQNHLLAALPAAELSRLLPHLEHVPLLLGQVLCESGEVLTHAYFPTTAIVSLHYVMQSGDSAEIAGVGNEGMLGISIVTGSQTTPNQATVQTAGHGYRLPARVLSDEFARAGAVQRLLLRYTQALYAQVSLTAACNRRHSVIQQLSRWLLLTLDRMAQPDLVITQELIATMLGVRREGVTTAAGILKEHGVISYRRGHITVLNRSLLNGHACECYGVVRQEFERLLHEAPVAVSRACRN